MEKADFEKSKEQIEPDWTGLHLTLFRYCLSIAGIRDQAEDLAQSAWLKAIPLLKEKGHANPQAFLLRIAKNNWIDQCRRQRLMSEKNAELAHEASAEGNAAVEIEPLLQALSDKMSPVQLAVFLLREVLAYSICDTAFLLGTTDGAVKSAHFRSRNAVKDIREEMLREERETGAQRNRSQGGNAQKQALPEKRDDFGKSHFPDMEYNQWLNQLAWACLEGDGPALVYLIVGRSAHTSVGIGSFQTATVAKPSPYAIGGITMMAA
ncbi:RNA polymerase sigma factor [Paenibacillus sp. CAU 1782]